MATFDAYQKMIDDNKTDDLSGSQPTKGNIRGGLTTIEEKAFGNLQKIGKKANYVGVLDKAEAPIGPGLWFMDTSSAAAEAVTLWAAAGFVAHFFPTGQGNIIGNPIEPVIKLTANPITAKTMSEHVDYDCSAILRGEMTLDQSGRQPAADADPHLQRPAHGPGSARPRGVRVDQAVRKCVIKHHRGRAQRPLPVASDDRCSCADSQGQPLRLSRRLTFRQVLWFS